MVQSSSFRLWFVGDESTQPVPAGPVVLARLVSGPVWDSASIEPWDAQSPRLHAEWHAGLGFVIQCYESEESWSEFLVTTPAFGAPTVEIELGGQALERWPDELFVPESVASQALEYFLDSGKQDPALHWVRIDAFPREVVWETGRVERPGSATGPNEPQCVRPSCQRERGAAGLPWLKFRLRDYDCVRLRPPTFSLWWKSIGTRTSCGISRLGGPTRSPRRGATWRS